MDAGELGRLHGKVNALNADATKFENQLIFMRIQTSVRFLQVETAPSKNEYVKFIVRIETPPLMDGSEVVRDSEQFDCEYFFKPDTQRTSGGELQKIQALIESKDLVNAKLNLRPFKYIDGKTKKEALGKSLTLKSWN